MANCERLKTNSFALLLKIFKTNNTKYITRGGVIPGNYCPPKYRTDMALIVVRTTTDRQVFCERLRLPSGTKFP